MGADGTFSAILEENKKQTEYARMTAHNTGNLSGGGATFAGAQ
jgi:hypothetical protein